jgi:hypothetical protein
MCGEEYQEKNISVFLSQLAKMQAYQLIHSEEWRDKSNGEKIYFLHQIGFSHDDITILVETTIGTVRKEISVRNK